MRRSLDERRPEKITGIHMANDFAIGEGIKDAAEGKKNKPCTYSAYMQRKQYEKSRKEKQ